jgi:hypothetical protein
LGALRVLFYFLLFISVQGWFSEFLFFPKQPLQDTVFVLPLAGFIAQHSILRVSLLLIFTTSLFSLLLFESKTLRWVVAVALFLFVSTQFHLEKPFHSLHVWLFSAFFFATFKSPQRWLLWTRTYILMVMAIAGAYKIVFQFTGTNGGDLLQLMLQQYTSGRDDYLIQFFLHHPGLCSALMGCLGIFQFSLLPLYWWRVSPRVIGLAIVGFHLSTSLLLNITFKGQMILSIFVFLVLGSREASGLISDEKSSVH